MHVTLDHVSKAYGATQALDDVSWTAGPGEIVALLGPNGAGKTTLLRCLAALAAPDAGQVRFDDQPLRRDRIDLRRRMHFLPDQPYVFPEHTVLNHLGMAIRLYEAERPGVEQRVLELLEGLDLLPLVDTPLRRLSRGQLYKTALAAMVVVDPELWLLDEPFASGMDPQGLSAFRTHAREAADRGRTVIYSTQILELAERFSDRVCILHRGRVQAMDAVAALRARTDCGDNALETIFAELTDERTPS